MTVSIHWITPDAQAVIVEAARVSSDPNASKRPDADLLRYLIRNKHFSPFEMSNMSVRIETVRDIGRQLLRHRSFSFQEFCVSGDTKITLELPSGVRKGKRAAYKRTIAHLYDLQTAGKKMPACVRVFDAESRCFVTAAIKEVFQTGMKPVFNLVLENGKSIKATKDHKFLTSNGFETMEAALGLSLVGKTAAWTKDPEFACNGVLAYKCREWMAKAKADAITEGTGLKGIADAAGVSTHTIRKWLKAHSLQFTKKEVASYTEIWNKGKRWSRAPHSLATIEKMRKSARRGPDSNLWRGGADRSERLRIADWCAAHRAEFLKLADYACARCGSSKKLELHHIEPVSMRPDLALVKSNIQVLCMACHRAHHRIAGHAKAWRAKSRGNSLTINWSKVKSVEYVGHEMTYDMEVDHVSHNYVANGIVTHNSQRYSDVSILGDPVYREARMQHPTNRQASVECKDSVIPEEWADYQADVWDFCRQAYRFALDQGIAKEVARAVLPEGLTPSALYMNGSIRSWIHFCDVRSIEAGAQKEIAEIADGVKALLREHLPDVMEAVDAT